MVTPTLVPVGRFRRESWNLKAVFLDSGPIGVPVGYVHSSEVLRSCSINLNLSDTGSATIEVLSLDDNLVGTRVQIQIDLNGAGFVPLFTGWLLADSETHLDFDKQKGRYTLVDGIGYLSQARLAFSKTYGGANLDGKGGNSIDAANLEMDVYPEVFTAEEIDYFKRADGEPVPDVLTRSEIIQDILTIAGYPYSVEFPNDGGYLGWEVAVTEEVPLDVIRLIAESVQWHFYTKSDGTLVFEDCYSNGRNLCLGFNEVLSEGFGLTRGKTPTNSIQVKGASKKWVGLEYQAKELGKWDGLGSLHRPRVVKYFIYSGFVYYLVYHAVFFYEYLAYTEDKRMPIKNVNLPGDVKVNVKEGDVLAATVNITIQDPSEIAAIDSAENPYLATDDYQYVFYSQTSYYAMVPVSEIAIPPLTPTNPMINMFNVVAASDAEFSTYTQNKQIAEEAEIQMPITGEVLSFIDREYQPSVSLEDTGSIAAFGKYKQVVYENPFLADESECLRAAEQIMSTSHRMGTFTLQCPLQQKLLSTMAGSSLELRDPSFVQVQNGAVESVAIDFRENGAAIVSFSCSTEYEVE